MRNKIAVTMLGVFVLLGIGGIAFAGVSGTAPIPTPPPFTISTSLLTLCKGAINYIPVNVTDNYFKSQGIGVANMSGEQMQYVEISLNPTKDLLQSGNGTIYLGNINANHSVTAMLPIFVSENTSLLTTVGIGINYNFLQVYSDSEVRNLTFEAEACPSPLSVSVEPKTLVSGEIQNVSINFTNTGNSTLKDLFVHYSLPSIDGAVVGSSQSEIGDLAPFSTYRLNASIFVSRNASIESFPFNLTATFYNGNDSIVQVSNSTSLIPIGAIDLSSSGLTLSPATVAPGGIISISFVLTDIGTSGASAVSVGAILPKGFSPFGTIPVYIGDISADSQSPVTLTLETTNAVRPGTYSIPLQVNYLNSLRQNVSTTSNVVVIVSNSAFGASGELGSGATTYVSKRSSSSGVALPLILIVIIAAVSYLYVKERKKNKKGSR